MRRAARVAAVRAALEKARGALAVEEISERSGVGRKDALRILEGLHAAGEVNRRRGSKGRMRYWLRTGSRP